MENNFEFYSNIFDKDTLLLEKLVDTKKIEDNKGLYQRWAIMGQFKDSYLSLAKQFEQSRDQLLGLFKQKYGRETTYEELKNAAYRYIQQMEQEVQKSL